MNFWLGEAAAVTSCRCRKYKGGEEVVGSEGKAESGRLACREVGLIDLYGFSWDSGAQA